MFEGATAFSQPLGSWDAGKVTTFSVSARVLEYGYEFDICKGMARAEKA